MPITTAMTMRPRFGFPILIRGSRGIPKGDEEELSEVLLTSWRLLLHWSEQATAASMS